MAEEQKDINKRQYEINEKLFKHVEISNGEMAKVKEDMAVVKVDIGWVKEKLDDFEKRFDKLDNRTWTILGTIILGFLVSLYLK